MREVAIFSLILLGSHQAIAQISLTKDECVAKFGPSTLDNKVKIAGGSVDQFLFSKGHRLITTFMFDGKVGILYVVNIDDEVLSETEINTWLNDNSSGMKWNKSGDKNWIREDGAQAVNEPEHQRLLISTKGCVAAAKELEASKQ